MKNKRKHTLIISFILLICALGAFFFLELNSSSALAEQVVQKNLEYGTWVWESPIQISQKYRNTILAAASSNGINVLYVTIDDYLDINALPEGENKNQKIAAYMSALQKLVSAANAKGIAVDAEAGWRDWGEKNQKYKALDIIDFVEKYNATHPMAKLRGIQFDVESHLLPTYESDKTPILEHFVQFVGVVTDRLGADDLKLGIVIPHFYDDQQNWTPAITYDGQTTFTYNHILRILDTRPGSSVIVMAYRNSAQGNNGAIQISNTEIQEASTPGHSTKVIVAQETGNVDPDYVTFFGKTKAYYLQQVQIICSAFVGKKGFGGIAVHYIDPFMALK